MADTARGSFASTDVDETIPHSPKIPREACCDEQQQIRGMYAQETLNWRKDEVEDLHGGLGSPIKV
ncbi:hypothetical protein LTR66_010383 [Elasticomyces elasticus]|nr:hypothetical protein LTR66_010383 [Elasticomyces elasticus]